MKSNVCIRHAVDLSGLELELASSNRLYVGGEGKEVQDRTPAVEKFSAYI